MLARIASKLIEKVEDAPPSKSERKDDEQRSTRRRTGSESVVSSTTVRKPSRGDDRDRGFQPTSTSYSSSSRSPYPGTAAPSVASSYATAVSNQADVGTLPPDLVRNDSMADQLPRSRSGRDERERREGRSKDDKRRRDTYDGNEASRGVDRDEKRERRERRRDTDRGEKRKPNKSDTKYRDERELESTRAGPDEFAAQVHSSGFTQFPGQYDGGLPGLPGSSPNPPSGMSSHVRDQFPGQYDGGLPGLPGSSPNPPSGMSSHVRDQFPGQFPTSSTAPYRPPLAKAEGGPGLATEYYGDAGESVLTQPGVRPAAPIINAAPHLHAALAQAAPPPEPSAEGHQGAAASFFDSNEGFQTPSPQPSPKPTGRPISGSYPGSSSQPGSYGPMTAAIEVTALGYAAGAFQGSGPSPVPPNNKSYRPPPNLPNNQVPPPTGSFQSSGPPPPILSYQAPQIPPTSTALPNNSYHSASAPVIPTLGAAAFGAAAGYMMGEHGSSQHQETITQHNTSEMFNANINSQRPPPRIKPMQGGNTTNVLAPLSASPPSQSSNIPLYAGLAGAAGLAAAAYTSEHHGSASNSNSANRPNGQPDGRFSGPMLQQHHQHHGPVDKFVDFWKDARAVGQYEAYSEYMGWCRYCFEPGTTSRDAPRKHYYGRRRPSDERLGASNRVDKRTQYGSDSDSRRKTKKSNTSWLAAGLAGAGLAKVGESLFVANHDFEDTYSVKTDKYNGSAPSLVGRHGSIEVGVTDHSRVHRRESDVHHKNTYRVERRSRSRSKERKSGLADAAIVAAIGSSVAAVASSSRRRSKSPKKVVIRTENGDHRSRHSPSAYVEVHKTKRTEPGILGGFFDSPSERDGKRRTKKKSKNTGFFNFGNGSSSSNDSNLAFGTGHKQLRRKPSKVKQDNGFSNSALLGLTAAAAAAIAAEEVKNGKEKRKAEIVAVKEKKGKSKQNGREAISLVDKEEDQWVSASEEEEVDYGLAYGVHRRRSQDSLRSDSSGTDKWSWRWGSKRERKKRREDTSPKSHLTVTSALTGAAVGAAAGAALSLYEKKQNSPQDNLANLPPPLRYVDPMPVSDSLHYDGYNQPIMTSRPAPVPLQHVQPIAPISSAVYTAQVPYTHAYTEITGAPLFPKQPLSYEPTNYDRKSQPARDVVTGTMPGSFPSDDFVHDPIFEKKQRRRNSSPSFEPHISGPKRASTVDDVGVRFALTEEEEERQRKERRRRDREEEGLRKESARREGYGVAEVGEDRWRSKRSSSDKIEEMIKREEKKPDTNSASWATPALAGVAGAVMGSAIAKREDEKKDDRQEKRREERRREDEASERERQKSAEQDRQRELEKEKQRELEYQRQQEIEADRQRDFDRQRQKEFEYDPRKVSSKDEPEQRNREEAEARIIAQAARKIKKTTNPVYEDHTDYVDFFAPEELRSGNKGQKGTVDISKPQIVTIEPAEYRRGPPSSVPYTFPVEEDIDPMKMKLPLHLAAVPVTLALMEPTPPGSRAGSVRGDASPRIEPQIVVIEPKNKNTPPSDSKEFSKSTNKDSPKTPSPPKVTFGQSETHEYEVITPMSNQDEFIEPSLIEKEAKDAAEREAAFKAAREVLDSQSKPSSSAREAHIVGIEPRTTRHMPGEFGNDFDFTATVAAGLEETGFDPAIVVNDPSFIRRSSPPGSEQSASFYQQPFYETVSDLDVINASLKRTPPTKGFVIGEVTSPTEQKTEQERNVETAKKTELEKKSVTPPVDVFQFQDLSDSDNDRPQMKRSTMEDFKASPPSANIQRGKEAIKDEFFDASSQVPKPQMIDRKMDNDQYSAKDVPLPEEDDSDDFESKFGGTYATEDRDAYESPSEDVASTVASSAAPEEGYGEERRSKRKSKSKRKSSDYGGGASTKSSYKPRDDGREVNGKGKSEKKGFFGSIFGKVSDDKVEKSRPKDSSAYDEDEESRRKKKSKERRSRNRDDEDGVKSLPSRSQSGNSEASKKSRKEGDRDDEEEPRRRKRDSTDRKSTRDGNDDLYNQPGNGSLADLSLSGYSESSKKSRKDRDKDERRRSRSNSKADEESGRVTQNLPTKVYAQGSSGFTPNKLLQDVLKNGKSRDKDEQNIPLNGDGPQSQSFLGERQGTKKPPDIDIMPLSDYLLEDKTGVSPETSALQRQRSRSMSPMPEASAEASFVHSEYGTSSPQLDQRRPLSMVRASDLGSSGAAQSPTSIPLVFRNPQRYGANRSTPSTPIQSPQSSAPLTTPRTRRERPKSSDFKANKIRPLFLVELHSHRDEVLPELPSNHSTSRSSSMHEAFPDQDPFRDYKIDPSDEDGSRIRETTLVLDSPPTAQPDILGSEQSTPTALSQPILSPKAKVRSEQEYLAHYHLQESLAREALANRQKKEILSKLTQPIEGTISQEPIPRPPKDSLEDISPLLTRQAKAPGVEMHETGSSSLAKSVIAGALAGGAASALANSLNEEPSHLERDSALVEASDLKHEQSSRSSLEERPGLEHRESSGLAHVMPFLNEPESVPANFLVLTKDMPPSEVVAKMVQAVVSHAEPTFDRPPTPVNPDVCNWYNTRGQGLPEIKPPGYHVHALDILSREASTLPAIADGQVETRDTTMQHDPSAIAEPVDSLSQTKQLRYTEIAALVAVSAVSRASAQPLKPANPDAKDWYETRGQGLPEFKPPGYFVHASQLLSPEALDLAAQSGGEPYHTEPAHDRGIQSEPESSMVSTKGMAIAGTIAAAALTDAVLDTSRPPKPQDPTAHEWYETRGQSLPEIKPTGHFVHASELLTHEEVASAVREDMGRTQTAPEHEQSIPSKLENSLVSTNKPPYAELAAAVAAAAAGTILGKPPRSSNPAVHDSYVTRGQGLPEVCPPGYFVHVSEVLAPENVALPVESDGELLNKPLESLGVTEQLSATQDVPVTPEVFAQESVVPAEIELGKSNKMLEEPAEAKLSSSSNEHEESPMITKDMLAVNIVATMAATAATSNIVLTDPPKPSDPELEGLLKDKVWEQHVQASELFSAEELSPTAFDKPNLSNTLSEPPAAELLNTAVSTPTISKDMSAGEVVATMAGAAALHSVLGEFIVPSAKEIAATEDVPTVAPFTLDTRPPQPLHPDAQNWYETRDQGLQEVKPPRHYIHASGILNAEEVPLPADEDEELNEPSNSPTAEAVDAGIVDQPIGRDLTVPDTSFERPSLGPSPKRSLLNFLESHQEQQIVLEPSVPIEISKEPKGEPEYFTINNGKKKGKKSRQSEPETPLEDFEPAKEATIPAEDVFAAQAEVSRDVDSKSQQMQGQVPEDECASKSKKKSKKGKRSKQTFQDDDLGESIEQAKELELLENHDIAQAEPSIPDIKKLGEQLSHEDVEPVQLGGIEELRSKELPLDRENDFPAEEAASIERVEHARSGVLTAMHEPVDVLHYPMIPQNQETLQSAKKNSFKPINTATLARETLLSEDVAALVGPLKPLRPDAHAWYETPGQGLPVTKPSGHYVHASEILAAEESLTVDKSLDALQTASEQPSTALPEPGSTDIDAVDLERSHDLEAAEDVPEYLDDVVDPEDAERFTPKPSKKSNKKGKRQQAFNWNAEPKPIEDKQFTTIDAAPVPAIEQDFEQPSSKKSKKKGKKAQKLDWDAEPDIVEAKDETSAVVATDKNVNIVPAEQVEARTELTEAAELKLEASESKEAEVEGVAEQKEVVSTPELPSRSGSKKGKNGKKEFVTWDEEPESAQDTVPSTAITSDADATGDSSRQEPKGEVAKEEVAVPTEREFEPLPSSDFKESKKKDKKRQSLAWNEEPEVVQAEAAPVQEVLAPSIAVSDEPIASTVTERDLEEPSFGASAEEVTAPAEPGTEPSSTKKSKKKGKKQQALDWNADPESVQEETPLTTAVTSDVDFPNGKVADSSEVERTAKGAVTPADERHDDFSGKKSKKKGKKRNTLDWTAESEAVRTEASSSATISQTEELKPAVERSLEEPEHGAPIEKSSAPAVVEPLEEFSSSKRSKKDKKPNTFDWAEATEAVQEEPVANEIIPRDADIPDERKLKESQAELPSEEVPVQVEPEAKFEPSAIVVQEPEAALEEPITNRANNDEAELVDKTNLERLLIEHSEENDVPPVEPETKFEPFVHTSSQEDNIQLFDRSEWPEYVQGETTVPNVTDLESSAQETLEHRGTEVPPEAAIATTALEQEAEPFTSSSSKESKKKVKKHTSTWNDEGEPYQQDKLPEIAATGAELVDERNLETSKTDVPSFEVVTPAEPEPEFTIPSSSKKSKKKGKKQVLDWIEEPESSIKDDTPFSTAVTSDADLMAAREPDVTKEVTDPIEPEPLVRSGSKKSKKKSKKQLLAWNDESESVKEDTPLSTAVTSDADVIAEPLYSAPKEAIMPAESESLSRSGSKKSKKKGKKQFPVWEEEQAPAESREASEAPADQVLEVPDVPKPISEKFQDSKQEHPAFDSSILPVTESKDNTEEAVSMICTIVAALDAPHPELPKSANPDAQDWSGTGGQGLSEDELPGHYVHAHASETLAAEEQSSVPVDVAAEKEGYVPINAAPTLEEHHEAPVITLEDELLEHVTPANELVDEPIEHLQEAEMTKGVPVETGEQDTFFAKTIKKDMKKSRKSQSAAWHDEITPNDVTPAGLSDKPSTILVEEPNATELSEIDNFQSSESKRSKKDKKKLNKSPSSAWNEELTKDDRPEEIVEEELVTPEAARMLTEEPEGTIPEENKVSEPKIFGPFSTKQVKKDKNKLKRLRSSVLTEDPTPGDSQAEVDEENMTSEASKSLSEEPEWTIPEKTTDAEDFESSGTKKGKKGKKKSGKFSAWEDEPASKSISLEEVVGEQPQERDMSRLVEEPEPVLVKEPTGTPVELESFSNKKSKKYNKKSRNSTTWDGELTSKDAPNEDLTDNKLQEEQTSSFVDETELILAEKERPMEQEEFESFSTTKSNKHKKKSKRGKQDLFAIKDEDSQTPSSALETEALTAAITAIPLPAEISNVPNEETHLPDVPQTNIPTSALFPYEHPRPEFLPQQSTSHVEEHSREERFVEDSRRLFSRSANERGEAAENLFDEYTSPPRRAATLTLPEEAEGNLIDEYNSSRPQSRYQEQDLEGKVKDDTFVDMPAPDRPPTPSNPHAQDWYEISGRGLPEIKPSGHYVHTSDILAGEKAALAVREAELSHESPSTHEMPPEPQEVLPKNNLVDGETLGEHTAKEIPLEPQQIIQEQESVRPESGLFQYETKSNVREEHLDSSGFEKDEPGYSKESLESKAFPELEPFSTLGSKKKKKGKKSKGKQPMIWEDETANPDSTGESPPIEEASRQVPAVDYPPAQQVIAEDSVPALPHLPVEDRFYALAQRETELERERATSQGYDAVTEELLERELGHSQIPPSESEAEIPDLRYLKTHSLSRDRPGGDIGLAGERSGVDTGYSAEQSEATAAEPFEFSMKKGKKGKKKARESVEVSMPQVEEPVREFGKSEEVDEPWGVLKRAKSKKGSKKGKEARKEVVSDSSKDTPFESSADADFPRDDGGFLSPIGGENRLKRSASVHHRPASFHASRSGSEQRDTAPTHEQSRDFDGHQDDQHQSEAHVSQHSKRVIDSHLAKVGEVSVSVAAAASGKAILKATHRGDSSRLGTDERWNESDERRPIHASELKSVDDFANQNQSPPPPNRPSRQDGSTYRDSGVHVAGSPQPSISELASRHRSVRDSGYQGTKPSPSVGTDFENTRDLGHEPSRDVQESHQDAGSANPLHIEVEVDPTYNVSVNAPGSRHGEIEVHQQSAHHEDSHYDQPESPTLPDEYPREPSLVDSTTKPRSSELFQSSPSTRDGLAYQSIDMQSSPSHKPTASASRPIDTSGPVSTPPKIKVAEPKGTRVREVASLFGGPVGVNSDLSSPPATPAAQTGSTGKRRLNTINEDSPEASPAKHARDLADMGAPEHGIKTARYSWGEHSHSDHVHSPAATDRRSKDFSTDDVYSRLSWPAVDEDNHVVDLDRALSRNTNPNSERRSVSRQSELSHRVGEAERRSASGASGASARSVESIHAIIETPEPNARSVSGLSGLSNQSPGGTPPPPPLRRVDSRSISSDLRAASKLSEAKTSAKHEAAVASSSTHDPITDKGKARIIPMAGAAEVYEGWGDVPGSPRSPSRPQSVRQRQSFTILNLEQRLNELVSENRFLNEAKSRAERNLDELSRDQGQKNDALQEALRTRDLYLSQKDAELNELRSILDGLHKEVAKLTEVNDGLIATRDEFVTEHQQKYSQLEEQHADTHQAWQDSTRELDDLRDKHSNLAGGMESIVAHEISVAMEKKNQELQELRDELEDARQQVRALQRQILATRPSDDLLNSRDEDYFETQCHQLCQHVQQWVLRFSKFSDMKPCRRMSEITDNKIIDRFDTAILDGSDVDMYLADRVKRRDVFMSIVMTMVWEYIFTRYLFGMDREQRQKLKALEKTLTEVGPPTAVNKWRAMTLTLLSRREAFLGQRENDTAAVVEEIYRTLAVFLPPPAQLVKPIQESLLNVMRAAVELSIEMRTQKAEYMMLPPLQPEYDTNGDLVRKVYFNPSLMNERSGDTTSNEELGAQKAVVRMVLFPLVVKKGDDDGVGGEEIVVCPAQVLVAKEGEKGKAQGRRGISAQPEGAMSVQSFAPSSMVPGMGNVI